MIEIFLFVLGLVFGSFLNVIIYRLPRRMPIIFSRSQCRICGEKIKFYDNIPVLSFIFLRGRCRYCGSKISLRYPLVEMLTAILFLLSYWLSKFDIVEFLVGIYLSCVAVIVTFIDFDEKIIPNIITYPGVLLGLVSSAFRKNISLVQSFLGVVIGVAFLYIIAVLGEKIFKREAMGFGDVKYIGMIGAFVGPLGVLFVIVISSFIGALIGSISLVFAKDKKDARVIPYGPYLSVAMLLVNWFGTKILDWYKSLFYI